MRVLLVCFRKNDFLPANGFVIRIFEYWNFLLFIRDNIILNLIRMKKGKNHYVCFNEK